MTKQIDERWTLYERNVRDEFKHIPTEDVKKILTERAFPFAVCFEQWQGDFNFAGGVRNANAFGAKEVFYIGKKRWDRRGAVGTHNYTPVRYMSMDDMLMLKEHYVLIGIDNVAGAVPMNTFVYPKNSMLVFGEEGTGITKEMLALCDHIVAITQYGSVRSLNASVASGITMFDYTNKYVSDI